MKIVSPRLVDPPKVSLYSGTQGRVVKSNFFSNGDNVKLKVFVIDENQGNGRVVFESASNKDKLNSKEETVGAYVEVSATFQGNVLKPTPSKMQVMFHGKLRTVKDESKPYTGQFKIASRKYPALDGVTISAPLIYTDTHCYIGWLPSSSLES